MTDDDDFIIAHGGAEQLNRTAAAFPTANQRYRLRAAFRPPFPAPWTVEETAPCFIVRDHNGQATAALSADNKGRAFSTAAFSADPAAWRWLAAIRRASSRVSRLPAADWPPCSPKLTRARARPF